MPDRRLRVFFALNDWRFIAYHQSTIRLLAERGHEVTLAFGDPAVGVTGFQDWSLLGLPGIHVDLHPMIRSDRWRVLATGVRTLVDVLRYLHPRYATSP